jgi:predicted ATPase with chaperone activity
MAEWKSPGMMDMLMLDWTASAAIRDRVGRARERQQNRFRSDKKINCNARLGPRQIKQHCKLSDNGVCPGSELGSELAI